MKKILKHEMIISKSWKLFFSTKLLKGIYYFTAKKQIYSKKNNSYFLFIKKQIFFLSISQDVGLIALRKLTPSDARLRISCILWC